jgi:hypothetical protein
MNERLAFQEHQNKANTELIKVLMDKVRELDLALKEQPRQQPI